LSSARTTIQGDSGLEVRANIKSRRLGVGVPVLQRDIVDGTCLPLLQRIVPPIPKPPFLLLLTDIEPVLEDLNSGTDEHVFERNDFSQEALVLSVGQNSITRSTPARSAAIEEDQFLRRW
jgi:hypothetical protein